MTLAEREIPKGGVVAIKYFSETEGKASGSEYNYFSEDKLNVGDLVQIPVRDRLQKALVTRVDVPLQEVEFLLNVLKTIESGSIIKPAAKVKEDLFVQDVLRTNEKAVEGQPGPKPDDRPTELTEHREKLTGKMPANHITDNSNGLITIPEDLPAPLLNLYNSVDHYFNRRLEAGLVEARRLYQVAQARIISKNDDLKPATDDLAIIAKGKKIILEIKKECLAPHKYKVDIINQAFAAIMEPLEAAERITKDKVKEFHAIEDQKIALARREAEAKGGEVTVEFQEPVPERTRTAQGTVGMVDRWTYEVVDFSILPDEYKVADHAQLSAIARSHHDKKPVSGVRFFNDPTVRTTTRG